MRPASLLWEVRFVRNCCLRRRQLVKGNRLLLVFRWANCLVCVLLVIDNCIHNLALDYVVSAGIGSWRHDSWMSWVLSAVSAVLPRRRKRRLSNFWWTHNLSLVSIKEFCVQIIDVAERINFWFLLRLRFYAVSIFATGTHKISEWCSFWVFTSMNLRWLVACRLAFNSKSVWLLLGLLLEFFELIPQKS